MLFPGVRLAHHLNVPTLVIGGVNDKIFSEKENEYTVQKYGADLIMVDNIAHDMMLDVNHKVVSEAIISWIESNRS